MGEGNKGRRRECLTCIEKREGETAINDQPTCTCTCTLHEYMCMMYGCTYVHVHMCTAQ